MKRLISFVLILSLLAGLGFGSALAAGSGGGGRYADVAESAWYYEDVAAAYELGLMEGVGEGNFAPAEPLTLAQAVTLAARARSLYLKDGETFPRHDEWYRVYVEYAVAAGMPVAADEDFDAPATRRRCAALFAAALPKAGLRAINAVDDGAIPDVEADEAVYALYRAGVMIGDEVHRFHPDDSIRRCEIAAVVNRLLRADNRLSLTLTLAREDTAEPEAGQEPDFLSGEDAWEDPWEEPEAEPEDDVIDEEGNSSVPYDLTHPEEFASGDVLYEDETILIKFRLPFGGEVNADLRSAGVEKLEQLMLLEDAVWYTAYLRAGTDVHEAVEAVRAASGVIVAEYNYVYTAEGPVADAGAISAEVTGNEQLDEQWYINSVGIQAAWQLVLGSKSQIFLPRMLEENPGEDPIPEDPQDPVLLSGGSSDVVVAVIDTGVDYTHPDLRANMWHNPGEIPENGIDDDGNGYVDDYYGVDVVAGRGSGVDDHGHGTHVAGIIAAVNNTEGVVGIAYNTRIMSVKAGMSSGYFSQSAIAAAVLYAADNGADVINMSFGGSAISIAVQDALTYAYTRCVLVAAAGNEGMGNDVDHLTDVPVYPAALPYVLGVMSVDRYGNRSVFSNYDCIPFNSYEYELYAPGEAMLSTIPGDRYAAWNGTSMAAPVVSAVAALLRSEFADRSIYPTKFIYGQLSGTGPLGPDGYHRIVNAYSALTVLPRPDVQVTDYRLFDTVGFAADAAGVNNGDGVIDAGETVALGFFLRNHWGMAKNVTVSVDALSPAGIPCPYLEILTEEADYGSVGTYSVKDAGQVMEGGELFVGWENPIYLRITPDCPNDYIISLNVHVTAENALDGEDETVYASDTRLLLEVRRGIVLPSVISEDMTLTKDNYYIIPNSTTVPEGVTLTVEAGTKIQFWTDDPHDAYADQYMASLTVSGTMYVNGTAEEPVELFPSELMSSYTVVLSGNVYLKHAIVTSPSISVRTAQDCEFRMHHYGSYSYRRLNGGRIQTLTNPFWLSVQCQSAEDCVFYKLAIHKYNSFAGINCGIFLDSAKGCAFIDCSFELSNIGSAEDCLFYGNNASWNNAEYFNTASITLQRGGSNVPELERTFRDPETGVRYLLVDTYYPPESVMERFAEYLGGTLACIETDHEREFLDGELPENTYIKVGLVGAEPSWVNGEAFDAGDWQLSRTTGYYAYYRYNGVHKLTYSNCPYYLIELPTEGVFIESITLPRTEITLDMDETYTVVPAVYPGTTEQGLRFFSGCETIAAVDGDGVVTPMGPGSTRIYICSEDMAVQTSLRVTVKDSVAALALAFPAETLTLAKGDSAAYPAAVTPADSTKKPTYSVSDPAVLAVDEDGLFTALDVGVCTVNAAIPGTALTAAVTVTVAPRALSLTAADNLFCLAPAEGLDAAETLGVILTQDGEGELPLSWLSSNPEVLDVNEDGELVFFTQPDTPGRWATLRVTEEYSGLYVEVAVCASDAANASPVRQFRYSSGYYALLEDGSLWYWGSGTPLPRRLSFAEDAVQFAIYSNYCLVLNTEGELNAYWLDGDYPVRNSDVLGTLNDSPMTGVRRISANAWHLYILTEDGSVWAMGSNGSGELGDGSTTRRNSLVQADTASLGPIADVVCGNNQLGVLTEDGELWVVGQYNYSAATAFILVDEDVAALHQLNYSGGNSQFTIVYADGSTGYLDPYNASPTYYRPSCGGRFYYGANVLVLDGLAYTASSSTSNGVYTNFTLTLIPGVEQVEDVFSSGNGTTYFRTAGGFYGMGNNDDYAIPNLTVGNQTEPSRIRFGLEDPGIPLALESISLTENGDGGWTLEAGQLILDFSAALKSGGNYGTIGLKADATGQPVGLRKSIVLDKLALEAGALEPGESYTLTVPEYAVSDSFARGNEALSYQFIYQGAAAAEPGEPEEPGTVGEFIDGYSDGTVQLPEGTPRPDYTEEDFNPPAAEFKAKQLDGIFYHCAFLNRLKDDNVEHWLRFVAPEGSGSGVYPLGGNYWGTVNKTLIGLQIVDYNDFTQLRDIDEGECLATAPETVWPFAVNAGIIDRSGTETDTIGNESVTFYVEFNRDMDTETPLRVRFGSYYPYADYEVEGDWVSGRRWEGATTLTTIIENGYQFWSIGSGRSADGKKLYEDWGRFRFEIDNTAAMAMTMQGSANADGVLLTWTQDDFDTLMGYNVYRAESLNGQYTRLNATVIPAETTSWFDANVEPGVVYYYNFTVVKTDMNESAPSGRISIMTLDTMAPVLTHTPVYTAFSGNSLTVSATVTDNVGVQLVTLYYRTAGETDWHSAEMSRFNDRYSAVISSNYVTTAGLEYYIDAFDGVSHALRGSAEEPFAVTVQVAVADSDKGDVNGDGRISSVDALMLLRAINGRLNLTAEQFARADINGDGELTAAEAMRILQYANGKLSSVLY